MSNMKREKKMFVNEYFFTKDICFKQSISKCKSGMNYWAKCFCWL